MFAAVWTGPECFAGGGLERAVCTECRTVVPPSGWRLSHLCYVKTLLLLPVVLPTLPIALTLSVYPPLRWTQECDRHRKLSTENLTDRYTRRRKLFDRNTHFRNWLKESDQRRNWSTEGEHFIPTHFPVWFYKPANGAHSLSNNSHIALLVSAYKHNYAIYTILTFYIQRYNSK